MRRLFRIDALVVTAVVLIAGMVAFFPETQDDSGYPMIAESLEPLRAAFNAEPGSVRAILLASPT